MMLPLAYQQLYGSWRRRSGAAIVEQPHCDDLVPSVPTFESGKHCAICSLLNKVFIFFI